MQLSKIFALSVVSLLITLAVDAQSTSRPPITGISHLCLYSSDAAATEHFYTHSLGAIKAPDPNDTHATRYVISPTQFVELLPLPTTHTISRLACVGYATTDARALHNYLSEHKYAPLGELQQSSDGSFWFEAQDPEGNRVQFLQAKPANLPTDAKPFFTHIIHAGYLVHNKIAEDRFYKDLLGFRPYWFGGMKEGVVDWVSLQTPEGHDWFEYMMVGPGSSNQEAKLDKDGLGVQNHFSLGVENMEAAITMLLRNQALSPRHDGPQMGLDGKWQANLYDPDGTRVELMEFQPVLPPCCSPFTAESATH
jgi:catechol 2,3-dioxygenase-like lactoylglutathione lyase family enzyme